MWPAPGNRKTAEALAGAAPAVPLRQAGRERQPTRRCDQRRPQASGSSRLSRTCRWGSQPLAGDGSRAWGQGQPAAATTGGLPRTRAPAAQAMARHPACRVRAAVAKATNRQTLPLVQ